MSPGGRIKDSDVDNVRERTDIVQLISEYVPLKKSGREFRGPCPFHKEKDPSFYVNPAKGVYFCFGCKASGGVFNFVMQLEGLKFGEAVERLADRIGYQVSYEKSTSSDIQKRTEKDRLFRLNQTAAEYFHYMLGETDEGRGAREYLEDRGFTSEVIEEFQLGFAPAGWENLVGFLTKKGFTAGEIVKAGLARQRGGGSVGGRGAYDVFRDRVMFPILDHRGRFVAFGGRRMPGEEAGDEPKYLNSPETPIYKKGHTLYGFHQARSTMQDGRESIVVEGYTDLLALWQVGVKDVSATLGTALTENHFDLLNRVSDSVYLAFDADKAGMDAALRTVDFWGRFRLDIFVVMLPEGEDPASVAKKGGAEAFAEMKGRAEGLLEFAVRKTIEGFDTANPMGRQRAMEACVAILSKVSSDEMKPLRNDLVRKIGGWLDMPPETVEVYLREASRVAGKPGRPDTDAHTAVIWEKVEKEALRVLLHDLDALTEHQYLDDDYFSNEDNRKILRLLKEIPVFDEVTLQAEFDSRTQRMVEGIADEGLRGKVSRLLMESPPECKPGYEDIVFDRLEYLFYKKRKHQVELDIGRINKKLEPKKYESLCDQLLEIEQVMKQLFPYDHG